MARIAHFRRILKDDFFKRIKFCAEFLSERDILDAAAAENYHWRDRIWTLPRKLLKRPLSVYWPAQGRSWKTGPRILLKKIFSAGVVIISSV